MWYQVVSKRYSVKDIVGLLRRRKIVCFRKKGDAFAVLNDAEVSKLAGGEVDLNPVPSWFSPPGITTTQCGATLPLDTVGRHVNKCKVCKKGMVVAKLAPGEKLDFDGVVNSLSKLREEALEIASKLDQAVTSLRTLADINTTMVQLREDFRLRLAAVKAVMKETS